jgi:type I restriction enzyme M protein
MGTMVDRTHKELTDDDIKLISSTYHAWRGEGGEYVDVPGFCKSSTTDEIAALGYVLTPGRFVSAGAVEDDGEPFNAKMSRLVSELEVHFRESDGLEKQIKKDLKGLGFGG